MERVTTDLNLARKWRPKSFDSVVGQDIAIRMLKNTLYLNKFFPVYLFAGQRGCGKTTSARIFAAAVNCNQLAHFQKNPTEAIPCMECQSCQIMLQGNHADFIEIDAASHTGVDNVRQIIESSSYMPLIGQKKVYLIDEAHMLSKAAFNAFLKILEEPPLSVLFILATTEIAKIPETVLSRCFHVIFNPIKNESLKSHLLQICQQENVSIDDEALDILLDETDGSVRDAINLLERVRFSNDVITEQTIVTVLGKISSKELFALFGHVVSQDPAGMISHLQNIAFEQRSAHILWDMLIQMCRDIIWTKYGVFKHATNAPRHLQELKDIAEKCSLNRLIAMFNFFWAQEELFLKTAKKHLFIEMVLLQLCQQVNVSDVEELFALCASEEKVSNGSVIKKPLEQKSLPVEVCQVQSEALVTQVEPSNIQQIENVLATQSGPWGQFLSEVTKHQDLLLSSILMQATFVNAVISQKTVIISLSTDSTFFKNKINETASVWQPYLERLFSGCNVFSYQAKQIHKELATNTLIEPVANNQKKTPFTIKNTAPLPNQRQGAGTESTIVTIKDSTEWPQATLILQYFSGRIKRVKSL